MFKIKYQNTQQQQKSLKNAFLNLKGIFLTTNFTPQHKVATAAFNSKLNILLREIKNRIFEFTSVTLAADVTQQ